MSKKRPRGPRRALAPRRLRAAAGGTPVVERRGGPRNPVDIRIDYETVDAFFSEFASNMSRGGLYINSANPLPPGTRITIKFFLPKKTRPIEVSGEVLWVNEKSTEQVQPGMGIAFEELDAQAKAEINAYVRSLRPSH